jgi:hypothetical protein
MWVTIRRPSGTISEIDLPTDPYLGIGDILEDGSVVLDLQRPEETDEDFFAAGGYEDDDLEDE